MYTLESDSSVSHLDEFDSADSPSQAPSCNAIWLLDDDASMLKALGRLLMSAGFEVEQFNAPATFLSRLAQDKCRLAILDVWMPDMNGLQVQASLRKTSPETRVIFISGRDDPSARQTALAGGALGFLAKPFEDEALLGLIRKAIGG